LLLLLLQLLGLLLQVGVENAHEHRRPLILMLTLRVVLMLVLGMHTGVGA
jgi:hypothetical protein